MTDETLPEPVARFAQFFGEWRETTAAHAEPLYTAATLRKAVKRAKRGLIEEIAVEWDGCKYEAVGYDMDIGETIRRKLLEDEQ